MAESETATSENPEQRAEQYAEQYGKRYVAICDNCDAIHTWERESKYVRLTREGYLTCGDCGDGKWVIRYDGSDSEMTQSAYSFMKNMEDTVSSINKSDPAWVSRLDEQHVIVENKIMDGELTYDMVRELEARTDNRRVGNILREVAYPEADMEWK